MRNRTLLLASFWLPILANHASAQDRRLTERSSPLQVVEPDAAERNLRVTPVVRAVQKAADSVLSIYLQQSNAGRLDRRRTEVMQGQGSGVILDRSGLVITNWHVIAPATINPQLNTELSVRLRDGRSMKAQLLSSSAQRDLALLQLELPPGETVQPIEIGRSSDLMIGETVIAIGNPQGHANTVTSGVLSATGRNIRVRTPDGAAREYTDLLQTDAAINQGNSGGALLDITGKLIGINSAMAADAENIGFAIPMDVVRAEFDRQLVRSASFASAPGSLWLGFEVEDTERGVRVGEVVAGSPAADAGVRRGDLLLTMGKEPVRNSIDYLRRIFAAKAEGNVPLRLSREGKDVEVSARPTTREAGMALAAIGALFDEVSSEDDSGLVRKATLAFYKGSGIRRVPLFASVLRAKKVLANTPAEALGLQTGDLLLGWFKPSVYGEQEQGLQSRMELAEVLNSYAGRSLRLIVLRDEEALVGSIDVRDPSFQSAQRDR